MSAAVVSETWTLGEKVKSLGGGQLVEIDVLRGHGGFATVVWRMADDERSPKCEDRVRLILAAPALLSELQKAHRLIVLMLNELTPAEKSRFIVKADGEGLIDEGVTRYHERAAAIAKATGSTS